MNCVGLGTNETTNKGYPKCIFLFSGKRKCGKDFITDLLLERIGSDLVLIMKISAPIKSFWAETKGLDLKLLMSDGDYKEQYRQDMIEWSDKMRAQDPGYFCKRAVAMHSANVKPLWIISDIRRKTDIAWFKNEFKDVRTVRVWADDDVRAQRGYVFTPGVDDIASECDLDSVTEWDWIINNNGSQEELESALQSIINAANDIVQQV